MGFFIKNVRRGFATNSSSSHSFVYMKEPQYDSGVNTPWGDYGWQDFRLNSIAEKVLYVATMRLSNGQWDSAQEAYDELHDTYPELSVDDFQTAMQGYVDHESYDIISLDQARDPHLVVFGGNDNDGASQLRAEAEDEIDWAITEPTWEEASKPSIKQKIRDALKAKTAPVAQASAEPTKKKVHINSKGDVRACNATKRACPYSSDDHFDSREAAYRAIEERYSA